MSRQTHPLFPRLTIYLDRKERGRFQITAMEQRHYGGKWRKIGGGPVRADASRAIRLAHKLGETLKKRIGAPDYEFVHGPPATFGDRSKVPKGARKTRWGSNYRSPHTGRFV